MPLAVFRQYFFVCFPLFLLWGLLLYQLSGRWYVYEQYSYGWYVPLIALALLWQKAAGGTPVRRCASAPIGEEGIGAVGGDVGSLATIHRLPVGLCASLFALLAFCYLPIRLIQGDLPGFRFVDWALGMETVGLTLLAVFMMGGWKWVRQLAFPICFILIAIPWPTQVESRTIHGLAMAAMPLAA